MAVVKGSVAVLGVERGRLDSRDARGKERQFPRNVQVDDLRLVVVAFLLGDPMLRFNDGSVAGRVLNVTYFYLLLTFC